MWNFQFLNKLISNRIVIHFSTWLLFFLIFLFGLYKVESAPTVYYFVLGIFIPAIIPVYFHFYLLEKFFFKKKYFFYSLLLLATIIGFGTASEMIFEDIIFAGQENVHIAGILTICVFVGVSTGLRLLSRNVNQKIKIKEAEAKQAKAELALLRSQVNPHFLFNSLNNIYSLILDDPEKAGETVLKLSGLMRYLLESSKKHSVLLKDECEFIKNYIEMEKLRLGDKCKLSFELEGNLKDISISPMLLIPFVENSFKHGSFATINTSFINIKLKKEEDLISFSVENSIGKQTHNLELTSTETGIENVKKRLNILFPERHKLKIIEKAEKFFVSLELAIH